MSNIHAAIEIGTTRTVLAVAETAGNGRLRIINHAEIPSTGVRKSQILDINQAEQSIRCVLQKIERIQGEADSSVTIGNAALVVSGPHVKSSVSQCSTLLSGARVTRENISDVRDDVQSSSIPRDRELLDIIEQDFSVDSHGGILTPLGMSGGKLSLNAMYVTADRNCIQNARTAATSAHLEIPECVFATTCAADAVLESHERKNGVLVLDLGGGSTGYAAYCDGYLVTTGVIGVGGDHVSSDISHAFQTTHAQSDELKASEASATLRPIDEGESRVKVQGASSLMDSRTISRRALDTVVNARLRELLSIIREKLDQAGLIGRLRAGAVLTGGGAEMRNIGDLVARELGMAVRIGRPVHVDGLDDVKFPASFAAISGALLYAQHTEDKPLFSFHDLFREIFS